MDWQSKAEIGESRGWEVRMLLHKKGRRFGRLKKESHFRVPGRWQQEDVAGQTLEQW